MQFQSHVHVSAQQDLHIQESTAPCLFIERLHACVQHAQPRITWLSTFALYVWTCGSPMRTATLALLPVIRLWLDSNVPLSAAQARSIIQLVWCINHPVGLVLQSFELPDKQRSTFLKLAALNNPHLALLSLG